MQTGKLSSESNTMEPLILRPEPIRRTPHPDYTRYTERGQGLIIEKLECLLNFWLLMKRSLCHSYRRIPTKPLLRFVIINCQYFMDNSNQILPS